MGRTSTIRNTTIRRACRKDKERFTEDKCELIVGLCKQGRTSEMYKEIRTLIKKFTPKLNVIKDANGETLTENDDILARWKEHCEGLFTKCGSTGASTTDCGDNEQDNSSETTDEDDEELIPLRSEVELAVKQLKNGKATGCDDISAEMIKASGELGILTTNFSRVCVALCAQNVTHFCPHALISSSNFQNFFFA